MAQMTAQQRAELWALYMQDISQARESVAVNKTDLRAAVDALDVWLDTNANNINAAIPQPARNNLTAPQKARLLNYVIRQRYLTGA